MKIKVYFEGDNQNLTIEINEHIIRNIPIQTAIERYSDYEEVISQMQQCCLTGDENSKNAWARYSRALQFKKESLESETIAEDNEHHTEHKSLEEILDSIQDLSKKQKIMDVLENHQQLCGQNIEFLAEGAESTAFCIGDKVVKFGYFPSEVASPLVLEPLEIIQYDNLNAMRTFPRLDMGYVSDEELQMVYNELRKSGYVWKDVKNSNLGRIANKNGSQLKIIDDGDIWQEEQILEDGYTSVLEFLDLREALHELEYQMSSNPEFDINNLKKYFSKYETDKETQIYVTKLEMEYEKRQREKSSAEISENINDKNREANIGNSEQDMVVNSSHESFVSKWRKIFAKIKNFFKATNQVALTESKESRQPYEETKLAREMKEGTISDSEYETMSIPKRTIYVDEKEM